MDEGKYFTLIFPYIYVFHTKINSMYGGPTN